MNVVFFIGDFTNFEIFSIIFVIDITIFIFTLKVTNILFFDIFTFGQKETEINNFSKISTFLDSIFSVKRYYIVFLVSGSNVDSKKRKNFLRFVEIFR